MPKLIHCTRQIFQKSATLQYIWRLAPHVPRKVLGNWHLERLGALANPDLPPVTAAAANNDVSAAANEHGKAVLVQCHWWWGQSHLRRRWRYRPLATQTRQAPTHSGGRWWWDFIMLVHLQTYRSSNSSRGKLARRAQNYICLSVCLSVSQSVSLSVYLSIYI